MAEPASRSDYLVGVDLGGTKILAGVFDSKLELVGSAKFSTKAQRGSEEVIERIGRCIHDAIDECDLSLKQVRGVGIGAPGAADGANGVVLFAPNLGWHDVPLGKELEATLDVPIFVENDCTVSMMGIYEVELKSKPQHVVGIFVGTGIGGGLIINGAIYSGHSLSAGEVGHMVLDVDGPKCGCGNRGCFEALASRTAIFQKIKVAVKNGQETELTDMLGKELENLRSGDLRRAIRRGDKFVQRIVQEAAEYTGIAVGNLINLLGPEVVVLGGGVIEALETEMMDVIADKATHTCLPGTNKNVQIIATRLGDHAGIIGAAVLARRRSRKSD